MRKFRRTSARKKSLYKRTRGHQIRTYEESSTATASWIQVRRLAPICVGRRTPRWARPCSVALGPLFTRISVCCFGDELVIIPPSNFLTLQILQAVKCSGGFAASPLLRSMRTIQRSSPRITRSFSRRPIWSLQPPVFVENGPHDSHPGKSMVTPVS